MSKVQKYDDRDNNPNSCWTDDECRSHPLIWIHEDVLGWPIDLLAWNVMDDVTRIEIDLQEWL